MQIQYKAFSAMEPLVRLGADVNARNVSGSSALHYACHYDTFNEDVVRLLVAAGAQVNLTEDASSGGFTPLHYAAEAGSSAVCAFLVAAGADTKATDAYGRTAEDCARDAEQPDCAAAFATFPSKKPKQQPSEDQSINSSSNGLDNSGNGGSSSSALSRYKRSSNSDSNSASDGSASSSSTALVTSTSQRSGGILGGLGVKEGARGGANGGIRNDNNSSIVVSGASSEAMAKIQDTLLAIQSDLQSALTAKEAQKREYETLLKERDLAAQVSETSNGQLRLALVSFSAFATLRGYM